jgi:hypothetical protein
VLPPGERKYFCEIDCHLAYAVTRVEQTGEIGPPENRRRTRGSFWIVRLETWFDPATISAHRGNAPLHPDPCRVIALDEKGGEHSPSPQGQAALGELGRAGAPLDWALRPGERYETALVFDLPAGAKQPRLLLSESFPMTRLLIGHENSLGHRKVLFDLTALGGGTTASRPFRATGPPPPG